MPDPIPPLGAGIVPPFNVVGSEQPAKGMTNAMGRRIHSGMLWSAALGAAAFGLSMSAAEAADYCVTCKNPDETYRCRVTGTGAKANDALKLYCVIRTAKEGNHASCSAQKATAACVGLVKVYTYDGPSLPEGLTSDPRARRRRLAQRLAQCRLGDRHRIDGQRNRAPSRATNRASAARQASGRAGGTRAQELRAQK